MTPSPIVIVINPYRGSFLSIDLRALSPVNSPAALRSIITTPYQRSTCRDLGCQKPPVLLERYCCESHKALGELLCSRCRTFEKASNLYFCGWICSFLAWMPKWPFFK